LYFLGAVLPSHGQVERNVALYWPNVSVTKST
jgi:hypothetical protein